MYVLAIQYLHLHFYLVIWTLFAFQVASASRRAHTFSYPPPIRWRLRNRQRTASWKAYIVLETGTALLFAIFLLRQLFGLLRCLLALLSRTQRSHNSIKMSDDMDQADEVCFSSRGSAIRYNTHWSSARSIGAAGDFRSTDHLSALMSTSTLMDCYSARLMMVQSVDELQQHVSLVRLCSTSRAVFMNSRCFLPSYPRCFIAALVIITCRNFRESMFKTSQS